MHQANLIEIFTSLQGEGPYVGELMTFVRFQNCALSCQYCDTPASFKKLTHFKLEQNPGSSKFISLPNPIGPEELTQQLQSIKADTLSLTGGEPLQHGDFLHDWLSQSEGQFEILLETNGILPDELRKVISYVDIVSMDFKIPSATGMREYWEEHEAFLSIAAKKEVYVKLVISDNLKMEEIEKAVSIVQKIDSSIPFIFQPMTSNAKKEISSIHRWMEFYELAKSELLNVRIIPQMHVAMGIL